LGENSGKICWRNRVSRARKAPGVYERRGIAWQVRITRKDAAGFAHKINKTFPFDPTAPALSETGRRTVFDKAKAFAEAERAALRIEKRPAAQLTKEQTLARWLERYGREVSAKKKGKAQEDSIIKRLTEDYPDLCARPVAELTAADFIGAEATSLESRMTAAGYKPKTIGRYLAVVSHCWKIARGQWGHGAIPHPLLNVEKPTEDDARERVIEPEEWDRALAELADASHATRGALVFLRWTAARRSEAVKLTWRAVNWKTDPPTATFHDTKTPKRGKTQSRTIPLPPQAVEVLRSLGGDTPPTLGPVFSETEKKPLRADTLTQAWARACKRAEIEDARVHDLRHTRITELVALGLPIHQVARISGHKDLRMLMRYYHEKPESIGQALAAAEAAQAARMEAAEKGKKAAAKKAAKANGPRKKAAKTA
jgi:integrase